MRSISFFMTQEAVTYGQKTVTRRLGWENLRPGTLLQGVVKAQGLKKGEKAEKLRKALVTGVRRESLSKLTDDIEYGKEEVVKEGFPEMEPDQFCGMFLKAHKIKGDTLVTRIEFVYVDHPAQVLARFLEKSLAVYGNEAEREKEQDFLTQLSKCMKKDLHDEPVGDEQNLVERTLAQLTNFVFDAITKSKGRVGKINIPYAVLNPKLAWKDGELIMVEKSTMSINLADSNIARKVMEAINDGK